MKSALTRPLMLFVVCLVATLACAQSPDIYHMYTHPLIKVYGSTPFGPEGLTPMQIKAAYGINAIPNQGQGQIVAIVVGYDDPKLESDLGVFNTTFNLPPCTTDNGCFQKVFATGQQPQLNVQWSYETSGDVEWVHAIAPAAQIKVVEAISDSVGDMIYAEQVAATLGASQVSNSWDYPEFAGETAYDFAFQAPGITYVVASGDGGHGTFYPSASPYVVAVGGTQLALLSVGTPPLGTNYGAEYAWSGSAGGISLFEREQPWQQGAQQTGFRTVPDVAYDEGPIPEYNSYGLGWVITGGTSNGAPNWAAFFAIVNSLRAANGEGPLSQAPADLYSIYYNSSTYAQDFHDITIGNNGNCGTDCDAGPGYDLVTGIGSPIANTLVQALVAMPN